MRRRRRHAALRRRRKCEHPKHPAARLGLRERRLHRAVGSGARRAGQARRDRPRRHRRNRPADHQRLRRIAVPRRRQRAGWVLRRPRSFTGRRDHDAEQQLRPEHRRRIARGPVVRRGLQPVLERVPQWARRRGRVDRLGRRAGARTRGVRQGHLRSGLHSDRLLPASARARHLRPRHVHGGPHRRPSAGRHRAVQREQRLLPRRRPRRAHRQCQGRRCFGRDRAIGRDRGHPVGRAAPQRLRSQHQGAEPVAWRARRAALHP